jgi:hypothetical protein
MRQYFNNHEMKVNFSKTKVMLFNRSKKFDFMPEISGSCGQNLEVVETIKLLGIVLRSDMKWRDNTTYICKKALNRLWILRRLKIYGASENELLDVWNKQCRSILEYMAPIWTFSITKAESNQIESCQRVALSLISNQPDLSYEQKLKYFNVLSLKERRNFSEVEYCALPQLRF